MKQSGYPLLLLILLLAVSAACSETPPPALPSSTSIPPTTIPPPTELPAAANLTFPPPTLTPISTPTQPAAPTAARQVVVRSAPQPGHGVVELPASTAHPGLALLIHPEAPGYIFPVDPAQWQIDQVQRWDFLSHRSLPGCRLDLVPPSGPPAPQRVYYAPLGARMWVIAEYAETAIYRFKELYLFLDGYQETACFQAQSAVLEELPDGREYAGGAPKLDPTATPRPGLGISHCPEALPTHLRPGDRVYIAADLLRLRDAPDAEAGKVIKTFPKYAPYVVTLLDGVSCSGKMLFREVRLDLMAEGSDSYTGWMAESDGREYYLARWDPGW